MPKGQGLEIMGNGMVVCMDGRVNLVSSEKRIPLLYIASVSMISFVSGKKIVCWAKL